MPISTHHRVWHMQGHYVPQLAQMIVDGNAKQGAQQLNLQGFLLGVHCCSLVRVCLTSQDVKQSLSYLGKMILMSIDGEVGSNEGWVQGGLGAQQDKKGVSVCI